MAKVNVYIDGFNLYYGALKGSPYKWLDLSALCHQMLPDDTNDSDLVEPVKILRNDCHFPIGILNPHQHHSNVLRTQATFMKRIRQSDVAACQFPTIMKDAKGQFHKPAVWREFHHEIAIPFLDPNIHPRIHLTIQVQPPPRSVVRFLPLNGFANGSIAGRRPATP